MRVLLQLLRFDEQYLLEIPVITQICFFCLLKIGYARLDYYFALHNFVKGD